jgi:probable rRNA maturation factor
MPVSVSAPRRLARLAAPLRALVRRVLRAESRRAGEIGLALSDDALLRQINRDWRGVDRATDVISFAYDEHEPGAERLPVRGDVLISLDRMRDQAKRYRVSTGAELARLVVHGTLHLCGHDHVQAAERRRMRAREQALLRAARPEARALDRVLASASVNGRAGGR